MRGIPDSDITIRNHDSDGMTLFYLNEEENKVIHRRYIGYTKKQAVKLFKRVIREGTYEQQNRICP